MLLKGQVSDGTDNDGKRSLAQAEGLWTYCASFSDCVQPSDCRQIINCQTVLNRQTVGRQTALHSRHPVVELSANCRPSAKSQVVVRTDYCMYIYRLIQSKHSLTTTAKTGDQTYPVRYLSNVFIAIWMHIFFFVSNCQTTIQKICGTRLWHMYTNTLLQSKHRFNISRTMKYFEKSLTRCGVSWKLSLVTLEAELSHIICPKYISSTFSCYLTVAVHKM